MVQLRTKQLMILRTSERVWSNRRHISQEYMAGRLGIKDKKMNYELQFDNPNQSAGETINNDYDLFY